MVFGVSWVKWSLCRDLPTASNQNDVGVRIQVKSGRASGSRERAEVKAGEIKRMRRSSGLESRLKSERLVLLMFIWSRGLLGGSCDLVGHFRSVHLKWQGW